MYVSLKLTHIPSKCTLWGKSDTESLHTWSYSLPTSFRWLLSVSLYTTQYLCWAIRRHKATAKFCSDSASFNLCDDFFVFRTWLKYPAWKFQHISTFKSCSSAHIHTTAKQGCSNMTVLSEFRDTSLFYLGNFRCHVSSFVLKGHWRSHLK